MAEIVGLITGIGTLVTTAFAIAKTISTVANDLGTAGSQIKAIATDTKAIAFVLRDLEGRVSRNLRKFDSEAESVLKETITLCTSEIKNMQTHLMPLFRSKEGRRMELKQRARWLFAKSKVSTTKTSLDSMKTTLGLLLHTIEYIEGGMVEDIIEDDIHEMIVTSKTTKEKFLKAQRVDMTVETLYNHITSQQTQEIGTDDQTPPPIVPTGSPEHSQITNVDESTDQITDLSVYQWASGEVLPSSDHQNVDLDNILSAESGQVNLLSEWAVVGTFSEESFLQIADHIRLQKSVAGFALYTIAQPEKSEDHNTEYEQTIGVNDCEERSDEGPSDRPYLAQTSSSIDDHDRQETIPMSSVNLGSGAEASRPQSHHEAEDTSGQGENSSNDARDHGKHSQINSPDTQDQLQEHWPFYTEAPSLRFDSPHWQSPPTPGAFEYFNNGASLRRMPDRSLIHAPSFAPPRASGQQAEFYRNDTQNLSNLSVPLHSQQTEHPPSDKPTPSPVKAGPNRQMEAMKLRLAELQRERKQEEENKKRTDMDKKIKEDAERAFKVRMEEMQRAQEEAKKEIELAKIAAERAARERIEKEREAEEERRKQQHAYVSATVEREARQKLEKETVERKRVFRSSKI